MGLDNGLVCRNFPKVGTTNRDFEFCYWRKFWDFRDEVLDYLNEKEESYSYYLQIPQLEDIRDIMIKYTDLEYVKKHNAQTIWNESEVVEMMRNNLIEFDKFLKFFKKNPGFKVYFYDSY